MPEAPETRESLIRRLPDGGDVEAWELFVGIYEPLIYRLARSRGLQHADAEDLVQEVLGAVARSVERWIESDERGPFRAWLFRIASNFTVNFLTRPKHKPLGTGDSGIVRLLEEQCDQNSEASSIAMLEYRRELFRWAAERVRKTVSENVWLAFWQTTVEEQPIARVADRLGMSVGSVYIARSRVTKKIRDLVSKFEEERG